MNSLPMNTTKLEQTENEKLLISLVRPEEYLYNRYHQYYRNHTAKHAKWIEIAASVNSTPKDCKAKWKALRDQYARELKRLARTYKDDSVRWKHYNDLDFLKKFITTRVELTATAASAGNVKKGKKINDNHKSQSQPIFVSVETNENDEMVDEQEQQQQSQQDEENWEFLDGTTASSTDFNEQSFDNNTLVQAAEQSEVGVGATEIVLHHQPQQQQQQQPQHHQLQQQQQNINISPPALQQQPHQDEEEDDSIHTFLKIEGYFEKQLISLVKDEHCLYNRRHPQYRNYDIKNQKWEEIAVKLKTSVKQARLKWKALRDQYTREFKRLKRKSLQQPIKIEDTSRWRHYDALCYLEEFIRERKDKNELNDSNQSGQNDPMDIDYIIEHDDVTLNDFDDKNIVHDIQTTTDGSQLKMSTIKLEQLSGSNNINNNNNNNVSGVVVNNGNCITPTTSGQTAEEDEVDAFFKAISMKVRHAKLSPVVFTDLQIEILRVINTKFRNFSDTF